MTSKTLPIITADVYDEKLAALGRTTEAQRARTLEVFTGPSIDLHHWAMQAREQVNPASDCDNRQALFKAIYAVLPAWGMHRMGDTDTKMPRFHEFEASLEAAWPSVARLWTATAPLGEDEWGNLELAYRAIKARAGSNDNATQIVSRSKVLTHLLPNVCAPIDRRYTLAFFGISSNRHQYMLGRRPDYEWSLYRELHERFFHRFASDPLFLPLASWHEGFGRSPMKIADDLIVANTP